MGLRIQAFGDTFDPDTMKLLVMRERKRLFS